MTPTRSWPRCDALLREGLALDKWQRVVAPAEANKEQAQADLDSLLAEREQVEATLEVADATGEFVERITALRAAVAGEVNSADGIRATQVALRRVFDGFVLHRTDAPSAPRRVNAELMVGASYVVEPRVAEEARLRRAARWNAGGYPLAAVTGAGQLTPVPPRPQ